MLTIVMYHYTRDLRHSRYPGIKGLDYPLFRQQLEFLKENFHIVTMEEVMEAWDNPTKYLPEDALLFTFDDGYIDNFTVAYPLLKEFGIQGSFFIPGKTFSENVLLDVNKIHFILASGKTEDIAKDVMERLGHYSNWGGYSLPKPRELFETYAVANRFDTKEAVFVKRILQTAIPEELRRMISSELFEKYVGISEENFSRELYMNRDQIRYMKDAGMFIGLHGYDHYWLGNLPEREMRTDIDRALEAMDEFIDRDAWVLNYPYGSYNDSVIQYISEKGCKLGMTTEVAVALVGKTNRFMLPRLDCNDFPPKSENYVSLESSSSMESIPSVLKEE